MEKTTVYQAAEFNCPDYGNLTETDAYIFGFACGADWQSKEKVWVPVQQYPEGNPTVIRWHIDYGCVISVKRNIKADGTSEWLDGCQKRSWLENEFNPFFALIPEAPFANF